MALHYSTTVYQSGLDLPDGRCGGCGLCVKRDPAICGWQMQSVMPDIIKRKHEWPASIMIGEKRLTLLPRNMPLHRKSAA